MSRNSADTSLRVFRSIEHYGLDITRAVLAGGASLAPYLEAFRTDLFLSAYEDDVQRAVDSGIAAGIICDGGREYAQEENIRQIRIAFDGDAVLFTDESERIFQEQGLAAFEENERLKADSPLEEGPFARFLKTIAALQQEFSPEQAPIRTALVTARSAPAHERVVRTLRAWNIRIDEAFFWEAFLKKKFWRPLAPISFLTIRRRTREMPQQQCLQPECPARKEKEEMTGKRILTGRT